MSETSKSEYTFKIKPEESWLRIDLKELWQYREVFYLLVWRDLKVRYKQTLLGVLWVILQPVIATLILTVIFTKFGGIETGGTPYVLFAFSGFVIWMYVNTSVSQASNSLVYHEQLVTKIYFPRMFVPASSVGSGLPDLFLTLLILFVAMLFYGVLLTWKILLVPLFLFFALLVALSMSLLISSLNVRFRDVKFIIPFLLQVWMFASPIFYPLGWVPERFQPIFAINPITGLLEGFRYVLFGNELNWVVLGISIISTILILVLSIFVFRKMEDDFADLL